MIIFYINSRRLYLKLKGLSDARIVILTKKNYGFVVHIHVKIHKVYKVNI